jgi:hypothetical protein
VRIALALSLALLAAACSRGPGPIHVVSIRASGGLEPLREAGVDGSAVEVAARAGLEAAGFVLGEGTRPHRAAVEIVAVRLVPPERPGGSPRAEVAVEIGLVPLEAGSAARETGTAIAPLSEGDPRVAWRSAVTQAARGAAEGLALAFAEEAKPLEQVIADLSSGDPRVRDHAVRVLADRRSPSAVPSLIERLTDEDRRVAHRAVGALAQIGDERAVGPLIEMSRAGDAALVARVARVVGDIGGQEAQGYLLTLEAGHPDPRVRVAAREALGELATRDAQAAALRAGK